VCYNPRMTDELDNLAQLRAAIIAKKAELDGRETARPVHSAILNMRITWN